MMKLIKWFLAIVSIGFLLVGGILIYAYNNINPQDIRKKISQIVAEKYHRQLEINGNISPQFFPLGLTISNIKISEKNIADGGKKDAGEFVNIGEVRLGVDVFALLSSKILVKKVYLVDSKVNLINYGEGKFNFTDLLGDDQEKINAPKNEATPQTPNSQQSPNNNPEQNNFTITVEALEFKNILINYLDKGKDENFSAKIISAKLNDFELGKKGQLISEINFNINNGNLAKFAVLLKLQAGVMVDGKGKIVISNLEINSSGNGHIKELGLVELIHGKINGEVVINEQNINLVLSKINIKSALKVDTNAKALNLQLEGSAKVRKTPEELAVAASNLKVNVDGAYSKVNREKKLQTMIEDIILSFTGEVHLTNNQLNAIVEKINWQSNLSLPTLSGKNLIKIASANVSLDITKLTSINLKTAALSADVNLSGGFGSTLAKLNNSSLTLAHEKIVSAPILIEGTYNGKESENQKTITAKFNIRSEVVGELSTQFTPENLSLKPININATVNLPELAKEVNGELNGFASANLIKGSAQANLNGVVGATTLSLQTLIKSFTSLDSDVNLAIGKINLDEWFPPQNKTANNTVNKNAGATNKDVNNLNRNPKPSQREINIDLSTLKGLQAKLKFSAEEIITQGIKMNNLVLNIDSNGKQVLLEPLRLNIAEGQVRGDSILIPESQEIKLNLHLEKVNFGEILKTLQITDIVRGRSNLNMSVVSFGKTLNNYKQNLQGNIALKVTDGGVNGFNLAREVREIKDKIAIVKGKDKIGEKNNDDLSTDFSELTGTFQIKNGVMNNKDLRMLSPYFRLTGEGSANLVNESLDFRTRFILTSSNIGQGAQIDTLGGGIPIKITGAMSEPKINIDGAALKEQLLQQEKAKIDAQLKAKEAELKALADKKIAEEKDKARAQIKQKEDELRQKLDEQKKKAEEQIKNKLKGLIK